MKVYDTDEEQMQAIKSWWQQYGKTLIIGIVLSCISIVAWQLWQQHHQRHTELASLKFQHVLDTPQTSQAAAAYIIENYSNTPYAPLSALMLAKSSITAKNWPQAIEQYHWIMAHHASPAIQQIARIRLARLQIALNHPTQALTTLAKIEDPSFGALIENSKGDAFLALNQKQKALQAFLTAQSVLPESDNHDPLKQFIMMKSNALITKPSSTTTATSAKK